MIQDDFKIVVLISGSGSNLQTLINAVAEQRIPAEISAVISNREDAFGLERARNAGIPALVLDHKQYSSREAFDNELSTLIDQYQPDLVVLAGFMRILSNDFVERYLGRMINIHPSLLPKYPGLHTHQRALEAGDAIHGASVHYVIPELDAGPVILQGQIEIKPAENAEQLASRVLAQVEHKIYPQAVEWIASRRIEFQQNRVFKDQEPLPVGGYQIDYENN